MNQIDIVSFLTQSLYLTLWLSMPSIAVASIIGTLFSLFQALTQIQEQTLSFAVKLVAVGLTIYLTARWMGGEIYNYTAALLEAVPGLAR